MPNSFTSVNASLTSGNGRNTDWFNESEWLVSHDVIKGIVMDYKKWHEPAENDHPSSATQSSPYANIYIERIPAIIQRFSVS